MWGGLPGSAAEAACELQVADELPPALAVDVVPPHRGARGAAPRFLQRTVLDGIEAEVVVEARDEVDGLG